VTRRRHRPGKPVAASQQEARPDEQPERYTYGATSSTRPAGDDLYLIDGIAHRWDGRCHEECPDVR
jgi:hypothetical protein